MAALSAIRCNPAVRALDARGVVKHPTRKAVAVGQALRKLRHLAWAVWTTGRPFDPEPEPWHTPAHVEGSDPGVSTPARPAAAQAAGLTPDVPARTAVTATCTDTVADTEAVGAKTSLAFAHRTKQLPLARVLDQRGLTARLQGTGPQRRGPCPRHRGAGRGRTVRVNRDEHVFHGFAPKCGQQGDVLDLWAAARGLALREAALDLMRTFGLEPVPRTGTEKRHG